LEHLAQDLPELVGPDGEDERRRRDKRYQPDEAADPG
jgi:hypothetical protein